MFVIGVGTGRCGTQTLSTYLGLQKINTRHESLILPWDFNERQAERFLKHLQDAVTIDYPDIAEVNFSLLNYIEYLIAKVPDLKVVVLQRLKEDTIRSWVKNQPYMNMWTSENHASFKAGDFLKHSELAFAFPDYDKPKEEALSIFWDDYYATAQELMLAYPGNIKIFDMYELFSSEYVQKDLLDFIEVPESKRFLRVLNKKIDTKVIVEIEESIKILSDLIKENTLDLNDFKSDFPFSGLQLLKFLLLGISLNISVDKMPELILSYEHISKEYFGDLDFLEVFEDFQQALRKLISFLNETEERYSYPSLMGLKVRELCIKSLT